MRLQPYYYCRIGCGTQTFLMALHHKQTILQAALSMAAVVHSSLQCSAACYVWDSYVFSKNWPHEAAYVGGRGDPNHSPNL